MRNPGIGSRSSVAINKAMATLTGARLSAQILLPTASKWIRALPALSAPAIRTLHQLSNTYNQSFRYEDLSIRRAVQSKPKPPVESLVFGQTMSDHMLEVHWTQDQGWGPPAIVPYHALSIDPAAKCLHYSLEIFEGMKAYRGEDNNVRLFRPMANMERMNNSAERSCLPMFDGQEMLKCVKELVALDRDWIPDDRSASLYLRPTMIGTEPSLGIASSNTALLYVICGPVGPYFPTGMKPVSLLADAKFVRAWGGGTGGYKMGSNYGPTIYVQREAAMKQCQQVLWLYGPDESLTEVGSMNIMVYWENELGEMELVTPPLGSGVILPGVTRRSLLEMARGWGEFKVSEKPLYMKDIKKALDEGRLKEMFGAGTACVVCPVERIHYRDTDLHIPTMEHGAPVAMRLYNELLDIQYGRTPHEWAEDVTAIDNEPHSVAV